MKKQKLDVRVVAPNQRKSPHVDPATSNRDDTATHDIEFDRCRDDTLQKLFPWA